MKSSSFDRIFNKKTEIIYDIIPIIKEIIIESSCIKNLYNNFVYIKYETLAIIKDATIGFTKNLLI